MIPKIIHYCWFGGAPLPDLAQKCIASWKKYCPDYEIIEWNETNYDYKKNPYMLEAYQNKKWAFVSDYAKLDIIYNNGGIHMDTDVEVLKPLDDLLSLKAYAGFEDIGRVNLGLGFGAEKGSKIIQEMLYDYDKRNFLKPNGELDLTPSPDIQTAFLNKIGLNNSNKLQDLGEITILPLEYLCPKNFNTGELKLTEKSYTIHHFDASWQDDYGKYAMELRWTLSKHLPAPLARYISLIYANCKYHRLGTALKSKIQKSK